MESKDIKGKYMILLKFYGTTWKPYFQGQIYTKEEAKELFKLTIKNFSKSEWALIKIEDVYKRSDE